MAKHKDKKAKLAERELQSKRDKRKNSMKLLVRWVIIVGVFIFAAFMLYQVRDVFFAPSVELEELTITSLSSLDNTKGNGSILLIEYSDFQCPACRSYEPLLDRLVQEHGDKVTVAYRHFPLKSIHANAVAAARASEAAAMQDAFWPMHDILFERQEEWGNKAGVNRIFTEYAEEIGLDTEQFSQDLNSDYVRAVVEHEFLHATTTLQLRGTPSFFLDGRFITVRSYEELVSEVLALQ